MSSSLPIFFVVAAGLCLSLVLFMLWQSLRFVLSRDEVASFARAPRHATREALLREKQELLATIRELRSEHELGKLSDADYEQLEQSQRIRARAVLRELDQQIAPHRERAGVLLEQAVVAVSPPSRPSAERVQADNGRLQCESCGAGNDPDAVFCKKCGARLPAAASS
jgi:ribosomal protein L40E